MAAQATQLGLAALLGLSLLVAPAGAQSGLDGGVTADEATEKRPAYRGSFLFWENNVSAETLGVGDDVQSRNPTYVMSVGGKGRYYLLDQPGRHLSLRGDIALARELTNSDSTTRRGETTFTDAELALSYAFRIHGPADSNGTSLELRPLSLVLPTSTASRESGRFFALGALVGVTHATPLLQGRFEPELATAITFAAGYRRWFARATVPTNPSLELTRVTADGRSVPTDQLSGSSLIRDELSFLGRWSLSIGEHVSLTTDLGLLSAWKYHVDRDVEICGVVATGCTTVTAGEDDNRYLVRTLVNLELGFKLVRSLELAVGYANVANQLGPDGRRRGMFYSPDASFYAALAFTPDELATKPKQSAQRSAAPTTN